MGIRFQCDNCGDIFPQKEFGYKVFKLYLKLSPTPEEYRITKDTRLFLCKKCLNKNGIYPEPSPEEYEVDIEKGFLDKISSLFS